MKKRIRQSGSTLHHEQIKDAQDILKYGFCDDVSYNPNIVSYKSNNKIPIKIYDQKYSASYGTTAKYLTMHNNPVELGQILYDTAKKEYWMCVESFDISGIHNEGKIGKCHRFLKWQDKNGTIKEIPAIITSASKYNNGENGTDVVYIGSDQLMIFIQLNDDTIKLDRNVKFLIDENTEHPTVYRITRADTALYTYMGKGFISIIVTECQYEPTEKELRIGVCDYTEMNSPSSSPPSEVPDKLPDFSAQILGNSQLKVNIPRTYFADFTDVFGNKINLSDINFTWNIVSDFYIRSEQENNWIKILADDDSLIGKSFLLQILIDNKCISEVKIYIIDINQI